MCQSNQNWSSVPEQVTEGKLPICKWGVRVHPSQKEITKQWMVQSPARLIPSHAWLPVMVYWVSAFIGTIQRKCQGLVPRLPEQSRPLDKSKQNVSLEHRDIEMLGWNEEVQWRGEGPRAEFHGAAAALRTSAHGAGESWKNFILQTQGIAGRVISTLIMKQNFF